MAGLQNGHLLLVWLQIAVTNPPIEETQPFLEEVREAVKTLEGGKAARLCNIDVEMLKDRDHAPWVICGAVCWLACNLTW